MTARTARTSIGVMLGASLLVACEPFAASDEAPRRDEPAVVAGRQEGGYSAVGYLLKEGDDAPYCTATVIAKDKVATAAHCVDQAEGKVVVFGLGRYAGGAGGAAGAGGAGARVRVKSALRNPGWSPARASKGDAYFEDVAVLDLETAVDIRPARLATSASRLGCGRRAVGYGRTTTGPRDVATGYGGERKSTEVCVDEVARGMLHVRGVAGGLCWGDSGAPLFDRERGDLVIGFLHGHADRADPRCEDGNRLLFTSAEATSDFFACALGSDPPVAEDTRCHWAEALLRKLPEAAVAPTSDRLARLDRAATRLDLARAVALALSPAPRRNVRAFVDPPAGELGALVEAAHHAGFLDGIAEIATGRFRAGAYVTRREVIVGLVIGLALHGKESDPDDDPVEAAVAAGLVVAYPDPSELALDATATRAEVLAMVALASARTNGRALASRYVVR